MPTSNTSKEFTQLFRELKKTGLESVAIRHYSHELLDLVNNQQNSRTVLNLLLKSADLISLRKLKNKKKLTPIYQNLIFDTALKRKPNSKITSALSMALQEKSVPLAYKDMIEEEKYGDALLRSILLLKTTNLTDPKNLKESIGLLNFLGFDDLARETSIYLLANKVVK